MTTVEQRGLWAEYDKTFLKVHFADCAQSRALCRTWAGGSIAVTTDYTKVTCQRCLKQMAKGVTLTVKR